MHVWIKEMTWSMLWGRDQNVILITVWERETPSSGRGCCLICERGCEKKVCGVKRKRMTQAVQSRDFCCDVFLMLLSLVFLDFLL